MSDCNGIRIDNHLVRKRTLNYLSVRLRLSDCGFESRCCHLKLRYRACFEQGVP